MSGCRNDSAKTSSFPLCPDHPAGPSLLRHRQTKGPVSARQHLHRRATPRLHLTIHFVLKQSQSSPSEPFPFTSQPVSLIVSRLRGRAARLTSHDSLSWGVLFCGRFIYRTRLALLSPSRLRSMEHKKEHSQGEAGKCIDERREEHHWRGHAPENIEDVEDERPR